MSRGKDLVFLLSATASHYFTKGLSLGGGHKDGGQGRMEYKGPHILVIEVLSPSVDLILQGEVKSHMLYTLPREHFGAGRVVHRPEVADHVRKPDCQAIVAEESRVMESGRAQRPEPASPE